MMRVGVLVTVLYLVFLVSQVWYRLGSFYELSLNEVGDFLAGALGPLSIFWLILGFKQQGDELKAQALELSNSVAEQKELVRVSMRQLEASADALALQRRSLAMQYAPIIEVKSPILLYRNNEKVILIYFQNAGENAKAFEVRVYAGSQLLHAASEDIVDKDESFDVEFVLNDSIAIAHLRCHIRYEDLFGFEYKSILSLYPMSNTNELGTKIESRDALINRF